MLRTRLIAFLLIAVMTAACSTTLPGNEGLTDHDEPVVPATTHVLDADARDALSVSADGARLDLGASGSELEPGDVIVSAPSESAPYGLLRRVVSVQRDGGDTIVATEPALLTDAIHRGRAEAHRLLTPADLAGSAHLAPGVSAASLETAAEASTFRYELDRVLYDVDGRAATRDDQVRANGFIEFSVLFDFELDIDADFSLSLDPVDIDVLFVASVTLDQQLELVLEGDLDLDFEKELRLASLPFSPIVIPVAGVPIVLTPTVNVFIGADGELDAAASFEARQAAELTAGVRHDKDGDWHNLSDVDFSFSPVAAADASADARVRGYVGGEMEVVVNGLLGPYARIETYLELEASLVPTPQWALWGGVAAKAGLRSDLFDFDYDAEIFDLRRRLIGFVDAAPEVGILKPHALDAITVGVPLNLRGEASDEDGSVGCDDLTWTSDVATDADAFPVHGCSPTVTFDTPGSRTITLAATDRFGTVGRADVTITVDEPRFATPPSVTITPPTRIVAGQTVDWFPAHVAVPLRGSAVDADGSTAFAYSWYVDPYDRGGPVVTTSLGSSDAMLAVSEPYGLIPIGTGSSIDWTPSDTFAIGCDETRQIRVVLQASSGVFGVGEDYVYVEVRRNCVD